CGTAVPSTLASSVVAAQVWGSTTSDASRPTAPGPYNVFARDSVSGVVSAAGPVAAGGDITLTSVGVNAAARLAVGLIAGGKATLSNGSITGNVTYGVASVIPGSVTVTGSKRLQPFAVASAFQDLVSLSVLLSEMTPTG